MIENLVGNNISKDIFRDNAKKLFFFRNGSNG